MRNISKKVDLLKYLGSHDFNEALIEYNNDIDKLYNDAYIDVKARLIDNFFDPTYINSKSFGTLVNIFNDFGNAPQKQLDIRDRNEYEYFNK